MTKISSLGFMKWKLDYFCLRIFAGVLELEVLVSFWILIVFNHLLNKQNFYDESIIYLKMSFYFY